MLSGDDIREPARTELDASQTLALVSARVSARAQQWLETARAYHRAYTKSRHFRRITT
jgi:hypothetical protein